MIQIKPGTKLSSAVSSAQFVVIRGSGSQALTLGGVPLTVTIATAPAADVAAATELAGEVLIGKRYTDENGDTELLCVKSGSGELEGDGKPLTMKGARALPASD